MKAPSTSESTLNVKNELASLPATGRQRLNPLLAAAFLLTMGQSAVAQSEPIIPSVLELRKGEVRHIGANSDFPEAVDWLVMRQGSRLVIDPARKLTKLSAKKAFFEADTQIIADGAHATVAGNPGGDQGGVPNCANGHGGSAGGGGQNGGVAAVVKLELGVVSFGGLRISAKGGDAREGGRGGNGGTGGEARVGSGDLCSGGNGGNGGNGGAGGSGGPGGEIHFTWWPAEGAAPMPDGEAPVGLTTSVKGGAGAAGGPGGNAGGAGGGKCRRIAMARICKGSGQPGRAGGVGPTGGPGPDGKVTLVRVPR